MKCSVGLVLAGFLVAVLMKEAASALDPKKGKLLIGRTYLGAMGCQGQKIQFPADLIQNSEDCLLKSVQRDGPAPMFASKKPAKEGGDPVRKGPVCELACIMQTSDLIDGDYKVDDEKVDAIIDASFGKNKVHKKIGEKLKEVARDCGKHLENLKTVDDERCSIMEPYATCVTNAFVGLCSKFEPRRGSAPGPQVQRGPAPLLRVGGLLSLG